MRDGEDKTVAFPALIKDLNIKSLRSGDKGMRVVLEVDAPDPDDVDQLNRLMDAQRNVMVAVAKLP